MNTEQIQDLRRSTLAEGGESENQFIETHISWVFLVRDHAYKIKKPIKYSFLDFSTLKKRKYFCEKEIVLNKRLAPDMYLGVVPVTRNGKDLHLENGGSGVIDYAVKMRRMDNSREMDLLLLKNEVTEEDVRRLAKKIAGFHKSVRVITRDFDFQRYREDFNDLESVLNTVSEYLGKHYARRIENAVERSDSYLKTNRAFLNSREKDGFVREGHGDLHSKNVFILKEPVIFDCIEFSEQLRFLDIINEVAFFCMDMEANHHPELGEIFFALYLEEMGITPTQGLQQLFSYYKAYRANVRAKVYALNISQVSDKKIIRLKLLEIKRYLILMCNHLARID